MKTSFSVKVTGSFTVSIEPSNQDEDDRGDAIGGDGDDDNVLVDVFLAQCMKSLVNDAVKKYVCDKRITVEEEEGEEEEEEEEEDDDDISSPIPKRRIPVDADDSVEDDDEQDDDEDQDEAGDLPNVRIEYDYADENNLSQKMTMMNLRRK
jgi:hypothetical protein